MKLKLLPLLNAFVKKLSPEIQAKIIEKLETLAEVPRPAGVRKLKGEDNLYRVRSGDYRIIYNQVNSTA
ncbi:type II toxin-antitoxin system RelE/ParE family toxin [Plectonema cf. radiosum LEGE 06105]|uniref:Type II toxin-antitoxin system RelE/ParE family toxin n=1 Tax=Plectonema cf. radiosum LEGE 06105 TaxID=945769 RepID=A0A8J7K2G9_9CYAN|nr:type II toxin-antitoxin system RelE/ParE family toxin [Plectonema radiosum]MBE9215251.1 type II toxin-antitoxin system RelE/ParE family toxin [Plectonema cf. radiosum LEGE 06105]